MPATSGLDQELGTRKSAATPMPIRELARDLFHTQALIDGTWRDAADAAHLPVRNPATDEVIGTIPDLSEEETHAAIAVAERCLKAFSKTGAFQRSEILRRWFEAVSTHREVLAHILTTEQGKPLAEARAEIDYAASYIEWYAEEAKRLAGEIMPLQDPGKRMLVIRRPVGVVAAITPFNFPAAMVTRKVAPALAAGCCVVLKPATETPFTALALAHLALKAGVPGGAFNVVTGRSTAIGRALTGSPVVRKLSFTGSTRTGSLLLAQCAPTVKRTSMELGGNAPFIVFADADIDEAVRGALATKFRNAGQACISVNRLFVHASVHDRFVRELTAATAALKVGYGWEGGTQIGPLISDAAVQKIEAHVKDARDRGGKILCGGSRHPLGSRFFEPTVIAEVTPEMTVAREETFGPLAPVLRFTSDEEAITLANASEFGLASYAYSRDISRVWRLAESLECGMLGVNTGAISSAAAPFGGTKYSGFGREGSRHGIDEYSELKYVCLAM